MNKLFVATALFVGSASQVSAHGHITSPPARNNGTLEQGGNCHKFECFWFSQITQIPGKPTLPDNARSINVKISSGPGAELIYFGTVRLRMFDLTFSLFVFFVQMTLQR